MDLEGFRPVLDPIFKHNKTGNDWRQALTCFFSLLGLRLSSVDRPTQRARRTQRAVWVRFDCIVGLPLMYTTRTKTKKFGY